MQHKDERIIIEGLIEQYEQFLFGNLESHLDDYVYELKNKIDIQRELLIQQAHERSKQMIEQLEKYNLECKQNLPSLERFSEKCKQTFNELKQISKQQQQSDYTNDLKNKFIQLRQELVDLETKIKFNKIYRFLPIHYENSFGNLIYDEINNGCCMDMKFEIIKSFNGPNQEYFICFDYNEETNRLAVGTLLSNNILLYDLNTNECVQTLSDKSQLSASVTILKWLNKSSLACVINGHQIKLWHLIENGNSFIEILTGYEQNVQIDDLLYVKTSNHLISRSSTDSKMKIWNLNNHMCVKSFDNVFKVCLTKNQNYLVFGLSSGGNKNVISICGLINKNEGYEEKWPIFTSKNEIISIEPVSDSKIALVEMDDTKKFIMKIFDIESRLVLNELIQIPGFDRKSSHQMIRFINERKFLIINSRADLVIRQPFSHVYVCNLNLKNELTIKQFDLRSGLKIIDDCKLILNSNLTGKDLLLVLNRDMIEKNDDEVVIINNMKVLKI